jgi:nitroreductase
MNIFETLQARRAVKGFNPDHKMSAEEEQKLFDHARLSPTAFNIQHWRFVTVKDTALRQKIRAAAWDQAQVTDSSLLVILCADTKAWEKAPVRYWQNAPQEAQDFILPALDAYYRGKERVQLDEVHRSCGMAGMNLMLMAQEMGYDSCPMDGFDYDAVGKLINLPADHVISFMIAIGKKTKEPYERANRLPHDEVVVTDRFV